MVKLVVLDFSGTITNKDIAKEASNRRFEWLGKNVDQKWLEKALATNEHYKVNKELISKYTGIIDDKELTIFMTEFFKYHTLGVVNERKDKSFQEGIIIVLSKIKKKGYKLAIVSGTRTDIIKDVFKITGNDGLIDYIFGQPPELGISNETLLEECSKKGEIKFLIGDKITDLIFAKKYRAKSIYVTWGHPLGGEKEKADFTVSKPEELLKIIK